MNLGIDIDNVVSDFDGELKKEFLKKVENWDDLSYQMTKNKHKLNVVNHINRNEIFNDFYTKMGHKYEK